MNRSKVFVHGISGGVGQILSQLLTADGLEVYGVTSTEEKRQLALDQGKTSLLRNTKWQESYTSFFDTVYDGIGHTLAESVDLLKNRGRVVFLAWPVEIRQRSTLFPCYLNQKYFDRGSLGLLDKFSRAGEKKLSIV